MLFTLFLFFFFFNDTATTEIYTLSLHDALPILTRKGNDISAAFPELARALAALPFEGFILDAELVVPDEAGRPSFQRLQNRVRVSRGLERSEEHTSELQSRLHLVCRLLLEKKKNGRNTNTSDPTASTDRVSSGA